ncbi:MAG: transcriptional repressor [Eubacteriales bacterium]|nr:transcriptional repressor [Eubacteriales bacterium]
MMEKKLRHSHQRDMIYEYLCSTKEHPSADMVYEYLRENNPNLSLGTVYRNLRLLEEIGQVRRVTTLQNVERYDACCADHAHFVCESCGRVKDLVPLDLQAGQRDCQVDSGDEVRWMDVVFGGICAACAASAEKTDS